MMLNKLFQAALLNVSVSDEGNLLMQRENAHLLQTVEAQIELAKQALLTLKRIHADIEFMRVDDSDVFSGTGECEFGHENVGVKLYWSKLAILSDEIDSLLKKVKELSEPKIWFVFHGDCNSSYRCEAEDRDEAMELCSLAFPDALVHAAVPSTCHGELVMEGYCDDPVTCPKCGARTQFGELPREGWQVHSCLGCEHSFIAIPNDVDDAHDQKSAHVCPRCDLHSFVQDVDKRVDPLQLKINAAEVVADIAFTAGHLIGTGAIDAFPDSRELMANIQNWAYEFETAFDKDRHGDDYMTMIDEYALLRLHGQHDKADLYLRSMM